MTVKTSKRVAKVNEIRSRMDEIKDDLIRKKAYYIHKRDHCDDADRNWLQAERELNTI
jgi:hypothetical protein